MPALSAKRVLVIAHREELLDQAALRIQEANPGMTVGIEQAERHAPEGCKVLVGSIQTFAMAPKRLAALRPEDFSLVVVDEAHHCTAASYLRLLAHFGLAPDQEQILQAAKEEQLVFDVEDLRADLVDDGMSEEAAAALDEETLRKMAFGREGKRALLRAQASERGKALRKEYRDAFREFKPGPDVPYLVGFTATPTRSDGTGLEWIFDDIAYSRTIREMMEAGWLCKIRGIQVQSAADISYVPMTHGDFKESALANAVDTPERNALAVQAYLEYARDRKALVFCVNVEHAEHMLGAFQAASIPSALVLGETPTQERRQRIAAYRQGDVQVLVGCMVFTEGFDAPETSCVLMARPTKSSLVYTQAVGRGTRIFPGKADLLVLDLVDVNKKAHVQNLNTLFGLPIKLKLGNLDVLEAVKEIEDVQGNLPMDMLDRAEALEDVKRIAQEFDPLAATLVEEYIQEQSSLAWVKTAFGYALGVMGKGQLGIVEDLLGGATLRLKVPQEPAEALGRYQSVVDAVRAADDWVRQEVPDLMVMLDRTARWRSGDATPKQIAFLKKLKDANGQPVRYPENITKGQASALIDRYKKERVMPAWARRKA
jgi:superfamily II DNA or RNA helicase